MPSAQSALLDPVVIDGFRRGLPAAPTEDAVAAPFAEGGKARDIVHLCSTLNLPAVFIDQQGHAFHASADAKPYLGHGRTIDVRDGALAGRTAASTARIEEAVSQALCAMGPTAVRRRLKVGGADPLHLTVLDYPNTSASQLLKAVVVVERRAGERESDLRALTRLLDRG